MFQHVQTCPPPESRFSNPIRDAESFLSEGSLSVRAGPPYQPPQNEHHIQDQDHHHDDDSAHTQTHTHPYAHTHGTRSHSGHIPSPTPEEGTSTPRDSPDLERGRPPEEGPSSGPTSPHKPPRPSSPSSPKSPTTAGLERSESAAQAYARSYVESLRSRTAVDPSPVQQLNSPPKTKSARSRQRGGGGNDPDDDAEANVHELDAIPAVAGFHAAGVSSFSPNAGQESSSAHPGDRFVLPPNRNGNGNGVLGGPPKSDDGNLPLLRIPHQTPVLLPEKLYCWRDEFVKPPRTHHCRICGTVRSSSLHLEFRFE